MQDRCLSRRDFQRLTLAAMGGLAVGCQQQAGEPAADKPVDDRSAADPSADGVSIAKAGDDTNPLLVEPHVCRGLNTCKGFGSDTCAGLSQCASDEAKHVCGSQNNCRGQGGCGETSGENACKGQGGCHVPLMEEIWGKTRQRFEELMAKEGKKVGPAPAPKDS